MPAILWLVQNGPPADLVPVRQAAALIGVDRQTIYNMIRDGRLRSFTPPGVRRTLVSRAEVLRQGTPRPDRRDDERRAGEAG